MEVPGRTEDTSQNEDSTRRGARAHVQRGSRVVKEKYAGSSAESLWTRLSDMDFINRGMLFAAILLLCFFPFIIVVDALAGRTAVAGLIRHLGLNQEAAHDVSHLFTSATATSNAISGTAWVFFILGGIAAATAIQDLYERAFGLESRGMRDIWRRVIWLAVLIGVAYASGLIGPKMRNVGGPVILAIFGLIATTAFWWFTMWLLLAGRIRWNDLFPSALATAICWLGMVIVFHFVFSGMVVSNNHKYGPIGIVFAFMSWLIAIGVVIILGAVAGVVWREGRTQRAR